MGARGNSGVIFSQIVRGAADVLADSPNGVDAPLAAQALRGASDAAYRAVRRPVEGTMLSVIRELAEEAEQRAPGGAALGDLLVELVRRGEEAVARTPEQLDVLREAGVVDAGGAGLLELVRGVASAVAGEPVPEAPPELERTGADAIHQELSRYRYCTVFVVEGEGLDRERLEDALEDLGDSLLVVGDDSALKVHVHTDDPGAALSLGTAVGTIAGIEIANMHEQTLEREERLLAAVPDPPAATAVCGVVAVVAGAGNRRLFESLAAGVGPLRIVEGGQTMNPSTADLLEALGSLDADEAILLPNNSNVLLAAEQAALHADRPVEVVPSDSLPAGLAAMVAFDGTRAAAENAGEMREAVSAVTTGEITIASRDVRLNGVSIRSGEWLGLVAGEPVAGGTSFDEVADAVVGRLLGEPRDVLTLLTGADEPPLDATARAPRGGASRARGRGAGGRPAALPAAALGRIDGTLSRWRSRSGSSSSRTTRSSARRSSCCSGCSPTSRSSPPSRTASDAVPACREHAPDIVLMDYRLPGLDGIQATAAVRRECPGGRRRLPHGLRERARGRRALRGRGDDVPDEGPGARGDRRRDPGGGADVTLTSGNTAIVLDSTADFPDAAERFENWRVVPLYVLFGEESFRDGVDLTATRVLRAPGARAGAADDLAADARRLPRLLRAARRLRARLLDPHRLRAQRHVPERRHGGRAARRRPRAHDRLGRRVGGDHDARARDPAAARPRHDRTRRWTSSWRASGASGGCSSPSTRSSTSPAAAGSAGRARSPGS